MNNLIDQFFDDDYYLRQISESPSDPFAHFVATGDAQELDPSPYFNTNFYKNEYPDWNANGERTALENFIAHEQAGSYRKPHPLIDPNDYIETYPDLSTAKVQPSLHYVMYGDGEGRSPSRLFNSNFYARCYLPLGQKNAFKHYVTRGRAIHRLPVPFNRTREESRQAAWDATWTLKKPIVLAVHDAQEAGVPLLLLDIARDFSARGYSPCFVLTNGGPLQEAFEALGPVFLLAEGWHGEGLFCGIHRQIPVLVNTAAAAKVGELSARTGHHTVLLIHEMRGYLAQQNLVSALQAAQLHGVHLVASFQMMKTDLHAELGELPVVHPGVIQQKLRFSEFSEVHRQFKDKTLFIGAGHGDYRKGFDLFLEACRAIHGRLQSSTFVWLGNLDVWAQGLAEKAQSDGLPLLLPGFVKNSAAWYREAAAYLLTSREDAGPTTAIHAGGVGTGFVGYAAKIGLRGAADALGRFVPPDDQDRFVEEALRLVREDSSLRQRERRKFVRESGSFSAYCDTLVQLVNSTTR
ncbi:glycosyltransferase [Ottowia thiooxydans]|uniref:Glycosyltransferase involved in cell wall biosynthesis n=1 Tax=Ottowia thiooxydans TaxID=219182 RepID=A0ABV2QD72_9BURK